VGRKVIQIPASDGCVYVYDLESGGVKKVCDVTEALDLPVEVSEVLDMLHLPVNRPCR
jgi:hypothetical protein